MQWKIKHKDSGDNREGTPTECGVVEWMGELHVSLVQMKTSGARTTDHAALRAYIGQIKDKPSANRKLALISNASILEGTKLHIKMLESKLIVNLNNRISFRLICWLGCSKSREYNINGHHLYS